MAFFIRGYTLHPLQISLSLSLSRCSFYLLRCNESILKFISVFEILLSIPLPSILSLRVFLFTSVISVFMDTFLALYVPPTIPRASIIARSPVLEIDILLEHFPRRGSRQRWSSYRKRARKRAKSRANSGSVRERFTRLRNESETDRSDNGLPEAPVDIINRNQRAAIALGGRRNVREDK